MEDLKFQNFIVRYLNILSRDFIKVHLSIYSNVKLRMILDNFTSFPFCVGFLISLVKKSVLLERTEGILSMHNSFTLNTDI